MTRLEINGEAFEVDVDESMPLLWVLRDHLELTGTKFGCGIGQCGACTVHLNGVPTRACMTPVSTLGRMKVTTIEGLAPAAGKLHPLQQAWTELDVAQCGYCQPGFIMATVDFLQSHPTPSDEDINANIDNLCRCGTYVRVRKAIHRAAELTARGK